MAPKIAIVYYSMFGHVKKLALEEAEGIKEAGGQVDIFQLPETLPKEALAKMHAPTPDDSVPYLTDPQKLTEYDGFLFGIPTRYGSWSSQWRAFWDQTGGLWRFGSLSGKYVGVFVSTGTQGGGQETTCMNAISTFVHHGMIFVPLGYKTTFDTMKITSELRGGSPWGAGTITGVPDGARMATPAELTLAREQGKTFTQALTRATG